MGGIFALLGILSNKIRSAMFDIKKWNSNLSLVYFAIIFCEI